MQLHAAVLRSAERIGLGDLFEVAQGTHKLDPSKKPRTIDAVRTIADFRKQVPVAPYEYVAPYIEKVQKRGAIGKKRKTVRC